MNAPLLLAGLCAAPLLAGLLAAPAEPDAGHRSGHMAAHGAEPFAPDGALNVDLARDRAGAPSGTPAPRWRAAPPLGGVLGRVPRTLVPELIWGDDEPLDVLVLGAPAGTRARARVVGALEFLEDGEREPLLLAVGLDAELAGIVDLAGLEQARPGACLELRAWFLGRWGRTSAAGVTTLDAPAAAATLDRALHHFERSLRAERDR